MAIIVAVFSNHSTLMLIRAALRMYTASAVSGSTGGVQMLEEAQHMTDQALELQVMAAILGNRLTRLNNPMLAAKLKEMKQRAEVILAGEE